MNNYWQDEENVEFVDGMEETELDSNGLPIKNEPVNVRVQHAPQQIQSIIQYETQEVSQEYEENQLPEDDEDFGSILNDARLRLEQGRLYEMIMNHNLFEGTDADERAVKFVQKQIRKFAKDQMEIMLGMRQEEQRLETLSIDNFPFNDLEVQALKAMASAATKGATQTPEAQTFNSVTANKKQSTSLRPIGLSNNTNKVISQKQVNKPLQSKPLQNQPKTPVKRPTKVVEKILQEEQLTEKEINEVFDPKYKPLQKPISEMSDQELVQRNKEVKKRAGRKAKAVNAMPMPDQDQVNQMYAMRAQSAAAHPQMQTIMNLLNQIPQKK